MTRINVYEFYLRMIQQYYLRDITLTILLHYYELGKLIIWLNANKLSIIVFKTHYMVFHRAIRKIDHKGIILNNYILQQQVHFTKKMELLLTIN